MSARRLVVIIFVSIAAMVIAGCGGQKQVPPADSVTTLAEALEAAGLAVNGPLPNDVLSSHFFSIPGVKFETGGEKLHAYEFESDETAAQQRAIVSGDGYGIGSKYVNWRVAPSFYNSGRLIVVYDGDEPEVKETLAMAMGERFAGSDPGS